MSRMQGEQRIPCCLRSTASPARDQTPHSLTQSFAADRQPPSPPIARPSRALSAINFPLATIRATHRLHQTQRHLMSAPKSPITHHVLDTALGRPAIGVPVRLEQHSGRDANSWRPLGSGQTDKDGRCGILHQTLVPGMYRVIFDTATYFQATHQPVFYPQVQIDFIVEEPSEHYHIPLLLSPYGYSTYRGS